MRVVRIDADDAAWTGDPRLSDYRMVRDPERVRQSGVFLAEGRHVVRILLADCTFRLRSLLLTDTALAWLEGERLAVDPDLPVYVMPPRALRDLAGYRFHQGCLAAGERPAPLRAGELLARRDPAPRLVVGLERLTNPDNVGAIFRSAAAFGADAVLLSPDCASPLYRKALRSSMGAALRMPFAHGEAFSDALAALRDAGFLVLALTARGETRAIDAVARDLEPDRRVALLFGAEDSGLSDEALEAADLRVGIPMSAGMDCLNVAAAAAVALHCLGRPFRER